MDGAEDEHDIPVPAVSPITVVLKVSEVK